MTMHTDGFFRVVYTFELLTDDRRIACADLSLEDIGHHTMEGHCSGRFLSTVVEEVDGPAMARLLVEQGSDPEFFHLDENGRPLCLDCGSPLGDGPECGECGECGEAIDRPEEDA